MSAMILRSAVTPAPTIGGAQTRCNMPPYRGCPRTDGTAETQLPHSGTLPYVCDNDVVTESQVLLLDQPVEHVGGDASVVRVTSLLPLCQPPRHGHAHVVFND